MSPLSPDEENGRPVGAYGALLAAYGSGVAAFLIWRLREGGLPERIGAGDIALLSIATQRASRIVTRDKVTRPMRKPFSAVESESEIPTEVSEKPRGSGLRRAIGELIICPYCLGQWIATAFVAGLCVAPRATRFVASIFAVVAGSDFLQAAYRAAQKS
jgi:hypothetical protein